MISNELETILSALNFHYLAKSHADFCAQLAKKKLSPYEIVEYIAQNEQRERLSRSVARRLKSANLGRFSPLSEFDWNWPKAIDREHIEELMTMKIVEEPANVIAFGPAGLGKTMIAKNLAYQGVLQGHSVLFTSAADMLADLEQQDSPRLLRFRMARYVRPKILVIDEVGYLSYSNAAADLLFQVLTARYEIGCTIITTNLAFKDWGQVFPGAGSLSAMIDRITHRVELIVIEGDSYRRKEAAERKQKSIDRRKKCRK